MKKQGLRCLLAAIAGICAAAAVWCGYSLYSTLREYERGEEDLKQVYDAIENIEKIAIKEASSGQTVSDKEENPDLQIYRKLKEVNKDLAGWIRIDGTAIDYPVMHTPDVPDFYLTHGFDGNRSVYGTIYMDAGCSLDGGCFNYLLYGHHMKNGSMFASLEKYTAKEYCEKYPVIGFDTLEEMGTYEIFAVFKVQASQLTNEHAAMLAAKTEEDYETLAEYACSHSFYDTGIVPQWPQQLLTLVTCEYTQKDGRLFVIARKISE